MHTVYHEFSERPLSDSCWSTSTGPDGRIYIACCVEHTGSGTATIVRPRPDGTVEWWDGRACATLGRLPRPPGAGASRGSPCR